MKKPLITRRQMLRGAAGFGLALPFLPSLFPRQANGQEPTFPRLPRFFSMTTEHGGLRESAMYPADSVLTQSQDLYPGFTVHYGNLVRGDQGGTARLSDVLFGASDRLTSTLASKMNVLRGLDIPFYIAHHTGGHLGNYARNDGNGAEGKEIQQYHMPTIDQLMAWSPSFYSDLSSIRLRSVITGTRNRLSWGWSSPPTASGTIQEVPAERNARTLFQQVFVPNDEPQEAPRPLIVDRVIEHYRSLRQSNRRLSSSDRQRLDDHMDRLAELQRRVEARPVPGAACNSVVDPDSGGDPVRDMHALCDVIAAAFLCGTSRIAVLGVIDEEFPSFTGDWHQDVAHQWYDPGPQQLLQESHGTAFREVFLYMASKLEVEDIPGRTILDDTLMQWTQESGEETHDARSIPVITAGSAAGTLKTGLYVDYRNKTPKGMLQTYGEDRGYTGLLYSQWLATVLQAMGLPRSEWQNVPHNGAAGYGYPEIDENYAPTHVTGVVENASDPLAVISV